MQLFQTQANLLIVLQATAAALSAARLLYLGIYKKHPALLSYLILNSAGLCFLGIFPTASIQYFWGFVAFQTATVVIEFAVVRELFGVSMRDYPNIRAASRLMLYGAVTVSIVVTSVLNATFWNGGPHGRSNIFYVLKIDQSIKISLTVVIISLLLFLSHYPLNLSRNLYMSSYFFSAVFLMDAATRLLDSMAPHLFSNSSDVADQILSTVLFLGWAVMLRRDSTVPVVRIPDGPREEALLLQLQSINQTLSRAGRR